MTTNDLIKLLEWAIRIVHCSHDGPSTKCQWPFCQAANEAITQLTRRIESTF
jgi:hypothetical protein